MDMRLIKEHNCEYWVNDKLQLHGEYKAWFNNGKLRTHCFSPLSLRQYSQLYFLTNRIAIGLHTPTSIETYLLLLVLP